jgi:flagellar protein FlbD
MIELQRINGEFVFINAAHILSVESTPDTLLTLTTGEKMLVRNPCREVIQKSAQYLRELGRGPTLVAAAASAGTRQIT